MPDILSRQLSKSDLALDRVIAILVLCVGIAFIAWPISLGHYSVALPSILLVSSLLYLLLRKRLSTGAELLHFRVGNGLRALNHVVFTVCLSLSVLLLCNNLYYRPSLYFAL